ncbi:tetratricopeptide (TPR) repeat protein [Pedobacter sp. UYP30]|uniref:tetratricopeptide repeat protein n=1 Tax=Pedobacter sp. UYP30 TaxID=1756400 RepID=UPI0033909192
MKKLILSIVFATAVSLAFAQKGEIADAKKGWNVFQAVGTNLPLDKKISSLKEALAHATTATQNDKTKDSPEAWSYKALLSSSIAIADTLDNANSDANVKIAEDAVVQAKKLDAKGEFKDLITSADENVVIAIKNAGFLAYNKKDFKRAYDNFIKAQDINPNDTAMVLNASILAKNLENYPKAIELSKRLLEMNNPQSEGIYTDIIGMELKNQKDTVAGLATLEEAKAKFPENINFITTETDIYIKKGQIDMAEKSLLKLVEKDPKNALYQAALGNVYLQQAYKKQTELGNIDQVKKKAEYTKAKTERDGLVDKAMPFYLKASELDPKNLSALDGLKTIYFFKNDTKNYEAIKKKIGEAGATKQ